MTPQSPAVPGRPPGPGPAGLHSEVGVKPLRVHAGKTAKDDHDPISNLGSRTCAILGILREPEDTWQDEALCAQIGGDLWFPEKGAPAGAAKRICRVCPVQTECLEYALTHPVGDYGIWGGLSEQERHRLRRRPA